MRYNPDFGLNFFICKFLDELELSEIYDLCDLFCIDHNIVNQPKLYDKLYNVLEENVKMGLDKIHNL